MDLTAHQLTAVSRRALTTLARTLFTEVPDHAPGYLQDMGYAAGDTLDRAFRTWLERRRGVADPAKLAATALGSTLSTFLVEAGWGAVTLERLSDAVLAVDASDAPEVDAAAGYATPCCYIMAGMLADLLSRIGGATVSVMEVECRSLRSGRCRFLVGAPETLQSVYEFVEQGGSYQEAVQ